ncbi:MAG: PBP1A family penicillin-binding protein [Patescibacteria group bacterium]
MPHHHFKRIAYKPSPTGSLHRKRKRGRRLPQFTLPRGAKHLIGKLALIGATGAAFGVLALLALTAWYSHTLPDPGSLAHQAINNGTKIYDRTGETVLYEFHGDQKQTTITLAQIPENVRNATLVAEDRNFYSHNGFDIRGFLRAVLVNIFTSRQPGGSTITQQLVKNTIVGNEKSYTRKLKELILSYRLEQEFSKDQILELYLNAIPYGGNAYGIQSASEKYFAKDANELSLAESATLAALPNRPSRLSPYGNNRAELIARQHYILDEMAALGYISEEAAEVAKQEELHFSKLGEGITAPHFVFYIQSLLAEKYGEGYLETNGLRVVTTLDAKLQKIAEEAVKNGADKNTERYGGNNAALIAIDPKTGQIVSMVGSKDYFEETIDGNVNVTIQPRQPGSSFKPIVYAAAFMRGYTPNTVLYDVKTKFLSPPQAAYEPTNFGGAEHGPVTIRQALAGSLNIPAVQTLYLTGVDNALNLADRLGYTTLGDRSRFGLSLVLGGGEVKLLEHAAAFQAFANDGVYHETAAILRVEDSNGNLLESFQPKNRQAMPTQVARLVTSILTDNSARAYVFGASSPLTLGDRPVGAKTGTTNDFHDGWTIGFTPSLVAGVWAGNNNNTAMTGSADGVNVAAPIWNAFMRGALQGTSVEQFTPPDQISEDGNPALYGKIPTTLSVVIDRASGKLATDRTPTDYRETRSYPAAHSILHYVDRDNPTGPAPEHPENDPNYAPWEAAVQQWVGAQGSDTITVPPTEYDDVHTIENEPQLIVTSPAPNQTVRGTTLPVTLVATAKRGIVSISYSFDGSRVATGGGGTGQTIAIPDTFASGFHNLQVEVRDDVGNTKTVERSFNYIP